MLTDVCRVHPACGRHVRPAGRLGWPVLAHQALPAWLKAAAARFFAGGGGILWRPLAQLVVFYYMFVIVVSICQVIG